MMSPFSSRGKYDASRITSPVELHYIPLTPIAEIDLPSRSPLGLRDPPSGIRHERDSFGCLSLAFRDKVIPHSKEIVPSTT